MRHQIFIASYRKDFEWLVPCLKTLRKFAHGFLPTVICVDSLDYPEAVEFCKKADPDCLVKIKDGEGFMRAQVGMMQADIYCPNADVIYLIGSDCLALRDFTPEMYCPNGRPGVLMNSYEKLAEAHSACLQWRRGTERVLGFVPPFEYMRRLPSVFPASIFAPMRLHVEELRGKPFERYIIDANKPRGDTSEANILGAFAHKFMPDTCEFLDIDNVEWVAGNPIGWPSAIGQNWSHGGLDRPSDACFEYTVNGARRVATGRTPRSIIADLLGE